MAERRWVVAEHGFGTPNLHAFFPQPADQPEEFAVTLEGVTAEVTGQKRRPVKSNTYATTEYELKSFTDAFILHN